MIKGDLVHIPQDAFLIRELAPSATTDDYLKLKKPLKALFWERDGKDPKWGSVYVRDQIWVVRMKDVYPIAKELENAS
tara:strand:+ start:6891 stop:7124 length:234 start_codon:yes stop_codon:yes gene_type:complete